MAIPVIEVYHKITGQRTWMSETALAIFTDYAAVPTTGPAPGPFDPLPQYLTEDEAATNLKNPTTVLGMAGRAASVSAVKASGVVLVGAVVDQANTFIPGKGLFARKVDGSDEIDDLFIGTVAE